MEQIINQLNSEQRTAVEHIDGPLLILAGAGSGKTSTITARLAYLIDTLGIPSEQTLTLTFTNKAAREMRSRALSMINSEVQPPLLCTFHKFGLLFLKMYISRLNRDNNFVIIDTDDKKRIIKQFNSDIATSVIANEISHFKNSLITPDDADASAELKEEKLIASLYKRYELYLQQNNLIDFDDLLLLSYKLLESDPSLREEISRKYQYIMIDEYQDTNLLQFKLVQQLCDTHNNICVVGDDDQSIYGWRGANIRNILEFDKSFEDTKTIKLETNYRSTEKILEAANALIEHNRSRLGKTLHSVHGAGEKVEILDSHDEKEESYLIAKKINELLRSGENASDIAILYRINALSRSIEEGLNREGVGYRLVGGLRFYDRAEIKDIISYIRLIGNEDDDFSLKRIINKPRRSLGSVSVKKIEDAAAKLGISMFNLLKNHDLSDVLGKKNIQNVNKFVDDILYLQRNADNSLYTFIDLFEERIALKKFYAPLPDGMDKVSNIDEFYGLFRDKIKQNPEISLDDFLNELALQSDQDQIDNDTIYIMSIHASKGLEFKHLFVIGFEEKFLPIIGDGSDIEEERRLGYVALTRAKERLTLSTTKSRFYKGRREQLTKSRFLKEAGLIEGSLSLEQSVSFKKGDIVQHKIFGMGRVMSVNKSGKDYKLNINFGGNKRDILSSFVQKV